MSYSPRPRFDLETLKTVYVKQKMTNVSLEEVTADLRAGLAPILRDRKPYMEFLRGTAAYEICDMVHTVNYDMNVRSERYDNPSDNMYMLQLQLFCGSLDTLNPEPREAIMFDLIRAFVHLDRTLRPDGKMYRLGQDDDEFVAAMVEESFANL